MSCKWADALFPSFQGQPQRLPTSLPFSVHLHHLVPSSWDLLFFPSGYTEQERCLKGAHCHSGFLWFRQAAWAFPQLCSKLELKGGPQRLLLFYKSKTSRPGAETDSPRQNLHWTWVVFPLWHRDCENHTEIANLQHSGSTGMPMSNRISLVSLTLTLREAEEWVKY